MESSIIRAKAFLVINLLIDSLSRSIFNEMMKATSNLVPSSARPKNQDRIYDALATIQMRRL